MAIIVPTVTAENAHVYREQLERIEPFAERIHIDLMDGKFTPNRSIGVDQLWWPEATLVDVHVMFTNPTPLVEDLIKLHPSLVIVQAESACNLIAIAEQLRTFGVRAGLSLLPETAVESVSTAIEVYDHLLIFSGNLGHQGGSTANLDLLEKVKQAWAIKADLEIGWDGGVNDSNVAELSSAGVEVINAGGFIHHSNTPEQAYRQLENRL